MLMLYACARLDVHKKPTRLIWYIFARIIIHSTTLFQVHVRVCVCVCACVCLRGNVRASVYVMRVHIYVRVRCLFLCLSVFSQTYVLLIPLLFSMFFIFLPHRKCAQITDISQLTLSMELCDLPNLWYLNGIEKTKLKSSIATLLLHNYNRRPMITNLLLKKTNRQLNC